VPDRTEQEGGTGGFGPQFITTHSYLVPSPQLFGLGAQDWFLVIGSFYFTITRSGPMDDS
jgi:hypothetical protein